MVGLSKILDKHLTNKHCYTCAAILDFEHFQDQEDKQSSMDREMEVVGEESQTSKQLENTHLYQLEEIYGHEEQVQDFFPYYDLACKRDA